MKLAARVSLIKPSPTLTIQAKANALKAEGRDIIGFGAGEPDFDTPQNIKQAAIRAIEAGFTKYTPVGGIDELKDAVIAKLQRDNQLTYKRSEVVISCGAKHSLFNIAQVLFEEGDEVVIPSPYWVSYTDIVYLTGAKPVVIKTNVGDGFKLRPSQLEAAITPRTRAIIISSPSNPAGVTYTLKELEALAEVIVRKGIMIISDDIYEHIIYDGLPFYTLAQLSDELKRLSIVVNGVSKTYSMTGWRIGYCRRRRGDHRRHHEVSEPEHLQPHFDCPKSGGRGPERPAGECRNDAAGIPAATGCHHRKAQCHTRRHLFETGRGVLCLSQCCFLLRPFVRGEDHNQFGGDGNLPARRIERGPRPRG